ncbi:hypothetical protein ANMWB30_24560 [Arthrobacter sp. MWB30]|nr:hypothetical protein ANMWB30_24560 [Arthrobacter sp. MWB30]
MKILNNGERVEHSITVNVLTFEENDDPVENLIDYIRDACKDLVEVQFRVDADRYFDSHELIITGTPTGDLAVEAKRQAAAEQARNQQLRVDAARRTLRDAGESL